MVTIFALRLPESVAHELPTTIAECNKMDQDSASSFEDTSSKDVGTDTKVKAKHSEDNSGKFNYSTKL